MYLRCSATEPFLADEEATEKGKENKADHERKAFVRRPSVAVSYDFSNGRIKCFDKVKALPDSIHDAINIFAVAQCKPQPITKKLLYHCG